MLESNNSHHQHILANMFNSERTPVRLEFENPQIMFVTVAERLGAWPGFLHCTALHCTALHCTALHCTALHCTALHCTALHFTAVQCSVFFIVYVSD